MRCTKRNNSSKSSQLVKKTNSFVCLFNSAIHREPIGSRWIEINKDAANAHKHQHELIIPTSLLNSTIPAQVRRAELKALVVKRCSLPCFDLLSAVSSWINMCKCLQRLEFCASFSSLKQRAGWTRADRGGCCFGGLFFRLLCFQEITDTWWQQRNIMQEKKKSQALQEQRDTLCSTVQTMQSMSCAFSGNALRHNL